MRNDTPIALTDITKMTPDEREALVVNIRNRRMNPVKIYEELSLMQTEARKEMLEKRWEKQLEMFVKELERADKAMDKLQARGVQLRAIELEIESL
jgi:hypothetical protein